MNDIGAPKTRVLVSYPKPLLAMGLAAALRDQQAFDVLEPGSDAEPDVAVTDYQGGLSLARETQRSARHCRVLVMTMRDREHDVRVFALQPDATSCSLVT